ncbi:hypothetical protein MSPP1_002537 [Malassezia sp. CBS 17886]|nr:hypothetical protein MSPP1_002537 [Malassezia sp. CBS 17886]
MPKKAPGTQRPSAGAPFLKLAENAASVRGGSPGGAGSPRGARAARGPSPPPSPHDAFLTPRTLESTFHRRLRTLLQDFVREATEWEEAHTLDGIRWATDAKTAWEQAAACLQAERAVGGAPWDGAEMRRAALVPVLQQLEIVREELDAMVTLLRRYAAKMDSISDAARALLVEAASGGREAGVFQQPMWGTWTMEQFVRVVCRLAQQYSLSTAHLAALAAALCAPGASWEDALPQKRHALEEFIRLPYLHPSGLTSAAPTFGADAALATGVSRHFLESVCAVEVRGW